MKQNFIVFILLTFGLAGRAQSVEIDNVTRNDFEIKVWVDDRYVHHHVMHPNDELNVSLEDISTFKIAVRQLTDYCDNNVEFIKSGERDTYNKSACTVNPDGWVIYSIKKGESRFPKRGFIFSQRLVVTLPLNICPLALVYSGQ